MKVKFTVVIKAKVSCVSISVFTSSKMFVLYQSNDNVHKFNLRRFMCKAIMCYVGDFPSCVKGTFFV